jgi:hypothetical protein
VPTWDTQSVMCTALNLLYKALRAIKQLLDRLLFTAVSERRSRFEISFSHFGNAEHRTWQAFFLLRDGVRRLQDVSMGSRAYPSTVVSIIIE